MAVPISEIGQAISYPCSEHERDRFLSGKRTDGVGIPIGSVLFWTRLISQIPSGCVLMDGKANAVKNGGSGFNLTGLYIKTTATDMGQINPAVPMTGGEHEHSGELGGAVSTTGFTDLRTLGVNSTDSSGAHTHVVTVELNSFDSLPAGNHPHFAKTDERTIPIGPWSGESHDHFGSELEEITILGHSGVDIGACIEDHPPHRHGMNPLEAQPPNQHLVRRMFDGTDLIRVDNFTDFNAPMSHDGGTGLTHNPHGHTLVIPPLNWDHTHTQQPHDHEGFAFASGLHSHKSDDHTHGVIDVSTDGLHSHQLDDGGHRHKVTGDPHTHDVLLSGGSHSHDPGDLYRVQLLPVERIF